MRRTMQFWRWLPVLGLVFLAFLGCGQSARERPRGGTAGTTSLPAGGNAGNAGDGGDGAEAAAGGSSAVGRGGSSGRNGGRSGAGGGTPLTGGAAGVQAGLGGGAGSSVSGSAGSPSVQVPSEWACSAAYFEDGECDCGCGVRDADCKRSDRIDECERCQCVGGCPGRVNPEKTTACLPPAAGWLCSGGYYGDGRCDCGCGVIDIDCDDESVDSCAFCDRFGSCGHGDCPANVLAEDNARCLPLPAAWWCEDFSYGDGTCDCGCGAVDVDCDSDAVEACAACPPQSCTDDLCSTLSPDDSTNCSRAPSVWSCPPRLYHDGAQCDCGCGFRDPDCDDRLVESCDKCNDVGSCSAQACPGNIEPTSNERCAHREPPEGWTCQEYQYADGSSCDCGCGVIDLDCPNADYLSCDECGCGIGICPGVVDQNDTTQCLPPPSGWLCAPDAWTDFDCDCGCGIPDPGCDGGTISEFCTSCTACSGRCDFVEKLDNTRCAITLPEAWTCQDDAYLDGICDCGCAALDADCPSAQKSVCQFCSATGSCSNVSCASSASTIKTNDNTSCD